MADERKTGTGGEGFVARLAALLSGVLAALFGARAAEKALSPERSEPPEAAEPHAPQIWPEVRPGWERAMPEKLPKPTYAPATLAFGITLAGAGIVTSVWVSVAGLIVIILGLAAWIGQLK